MGTDRLPKRFPIDDFAPLAESLEWRLSSSYWQQAGTSAFAHGNVPYLITSSGRLSVDAAEILYANLLDAPGGDTETITICEFGAGSGLFALGLLNAFQKICAEQQTNWYLRLRYIVTDSSPASVHNWSRQGQFAAHADHVTLAVACAGEFDTIRNLNGEPLDFPQVRAVFMNYTLDVLPAAVLRAAPAGVEVLEVRALMEDNEQALSTFGFRSVEQVREILKSGDVSKGAQILPLIEFETRFAPATASQLDEFQLASPPEPGQLLLVNYGAAKCLRSVMQQLEPGGFLLTNDYGSVSADAVYTTPQRFGSTIAMGLNFSGLEDTLRSEGVLVHAPAGDQQALLHRRLLCLNILPNTADVFMGRGNHAHLQQYDQTLEQARKAALEGQLNQAFELYKTLVTEHSEDWTLYGEVAEFLSLQVKDYELALALVRAALQRNPYYSSWLWNIAGDILFTKGQMDAAHDAYLRARAIDSRDPRAHLNLAFTYQQQGDVDAALAAVASGFACDVRVLFRDRLLEKQQQLLTVLADQKTMEERWLQRREDSLRATAAVAKADIPSTPSERYL